MAKLTGRARDVLNIAAQEAVRAGRRTVGADMLLIALLCEERSAAAVALEAEGVDREKLRDALRAQFPQSRRILEGEPIRNRRLRRALDAAFEAAKQLGNPYIGTEHILLGVAPNLSREGRRAAEEAGVAVESLEARIRALGAQKVADGTPDRWNELLKAELAEKLKEIDLDAATPPARATKPAEPEHPSQSRWEYRASALGGEWRSTEKLARDIEERVNRECAQGWEYVQVSLLQGPEGPSAVLVVRRRV
jgi:ATP-dependent Clp protease ATP-binding subunit ClpA